MVQTRRAAVSAAIALLGVLYPAEVLSQQTNHPDLLRAIEAYDAGDLQQALSQLQAAPALLDPNDSAVRSIYTGLIRFAQGDPERARVAFALAVRTVPTIRLDPAVHSPSRVAVFDAARAGVVEELRAAAELAESAGDPGGALQAWLVVLDAEPADEQALGRVEELREELRGEAMRRHAELVAEATTVEVQPPPDSTEEESPVVTARRYSPAQALALGLVVPGLGQFYTGRSLRGVLALGVAGGALAAGLVSERLEVDCRSIPVDNECPAGDILDERTRRPYLAPAIAVAAGVALLSAIDAFIAARNANTAAGSMVGGADGGLRLLYPSLSVGSDAVRAQLVRLRFR